MRPKKPVKTDRYASAALQQLYLKKFGIIALLWFVLDLATKQVVRLSGFRTSGNLIDIVYITNRGSLFSLFDGAAFVNLIFIVLSFAALAFISYYLKEGIQRQELLPLALITGGILGNLFDRIVFGAVIDWINPHIWPIFNLADTGISIGVVWLMILTLRRKD